MYKRITPSSYHDERPKLSIIFFFNDTATTEIYTLSLHDALPVSPSAWSRGTRSPPRPRSTRSVGRRDRKSTRLNSSHTVISYAVFCLKKKRKNTTECSVLSYNHRTH